MVSALASRAAEEEGVLDHDARLRVGGVRELVAGQTSPAAKMRGLVVRRSVVDATPRRAVEGDARRARGRAPRRWARGRRRPGSASTASRLGRAADVEVRRSASPPLALHARDRRAEDAAARRRGSARARRRRRRRRPRAAGAAGRRSSSVTSAPRRANAWASSQPIGPAADHGQPAGQLGQVEDGLVGEVAGLGEPGDRRRRGRAPVAMTARRKRSVRPSTSTARAR